MRGHRWLTNIACVIVSPPSPPPKHARCDCPSHPLTSVRIMLRLVCDFQASTVADGAMIGMKAILEDASVEQGGIVAAGAVVVPGTVVGAGQVSTMGVSWFCCVLCILGASFGGDETESVQRIFPRRYVVNFEGGQSCCAACRPLRFYPFASNQLVKPDVLARTGDLSQQYRTEG